MTDKNFFAKKVLSKNGGFTSFSPRNKSVNFKMVSRKNLGVLVLAAMAASCTASGDKTLEGKTGGSKVGAGITPEVTQTSTPHQDELNRKRLDELAFLYPSPHMAPIYVGDFEAFIDTKASERGLEVAKSFNNADYWSKRLENFDAASSEYHPYQAMDITTREKLEKIVVEPKSRNNLHKAIIAEERGRVRIDALDIRLGQGPLPSTFPVLFFNFEFYGKKGEPVIFYFPKSAFEKRSLYEAGDITKSEEISSQTNSLVSYMFAKIYAEQLAYGEPTGKLSAAEIKSLNDIGAIVNRRSALIETHEYFRQMTGQNSPEAIFVGMVLKNSKHF